VQKEVVRAAMGRSRREPSGVRRVMWRVKEKPGDRVAHGS
jgi:hypothetical protein